MVTLGRFHCLGFNGELEKKRRLDIIERNNVVWFNGSRHFKSGWINTLEKVIYQEPDAYYTEDDLISMESNMNKNENEIKSQIKQLIITGKLWCDNCGEISEIQWEEWVCDYNGWVSYGHEHPRNKDGESVCEDGLCNPRDEEVIFDGIDIDEATKYILQKEVHPRCAECGSLYGW